ncbi:PAS domain S-box-containing protein [Halogranum amylolyticum]|uniref:histidine kinase n=1 Tax=Halogranum amylolyticum TaxID=660520 RepID=A0A1H8TBU6_9EURY|nr:PAS domain S-box protein [Halogranum amylolyticum]SEO88372.1 PAS domain S-box-containing protein [Halogranum amylolyticum]
MVRPDAPIRVLHVDDQPALGELVKTHLERYEGGGDVDVEVISVTTACEARDRLDGSRIDCVVSDYEMPETDGLKLLEAVRCQYPDLPFILFTGKGSEEVARDAFRVGATDYMQKETGTDQYAVLANRVHNAVAQYRAETASERYGAAIEALENAVYVLDGERRFTSVDELFVETTGYDRETILGTHVGEIDADGTMVDHLELLTDSAESDTVQFDAEIRDGDGERRHYCYHLTTHQFAGESPRSVVGTLSDRTDHDGRRADRRYYDGLTDLVIDTSTTLMGAETDEVDTKLRWTLQSVAEYVGAGRATIYSTESAPALGGDGGDDASVTLADVEKSHEWRRSGVAPGDETAADCPGAEWWLDQFRRFENVRIERLSAMPPAADSLRERYERQGVSSVVAVPLVGDWSLRGVLEFASHDTERSWSDREVRLLRTLGDLVGHTLERRRRDREMARYETLVETVPDGVFLLDEAGRMTQVNEAFAASLGAEVDDVLGDPFLDLVDEGLVASGIAEEYVEGVDAMLSGDREKNVFEVEIDAPDTDGRRTYEAHTRLLPHDDSFRGIAGIARDVTDELDQRARLRRQNERLDEFASVVSHDLRNPLNVAQGFLEMARETGDDSYLSRVEEALGRIDHLADDVLSLARRGQTIGETSQIDLGRSVTRAWETVESHDATVEVADGLETVVADGTRFSEALQNLFRNAVEHGGHDVAVTVGPLAADRGFYVADDGPGIPPDRRTTVFDHGHTTSNAGTGFGLAIVRDIVEAHGWEITVVASETGGARFEIRFGRSDADRQTAELE